jgi:hypothetical protein
VVQRARNLQGQQGGRVKTPFSTVLMVLRVTPTCNGKLGLGQPRRARRAFM